MTRRQPPAGNDSSLPEKVRLLQEELKRIGALIGEQSEATEGFRRLLKSIAGLIESVETDAAEQGLTGWRAHEALLLTVFATPKEAERYADLNGLRFRERDAARRIAIWEEADLLYRTFRSRHDCQQALDVGDVAQARLIRSSNKKWFELHRHIRTAMNAVGWSDFSFSLRDLRHLSISYYSEHQQRVDEFREPFLRRLFLAFGAPVSRTFRIAFSPTTLPAGEGEPILVALDSYDYRPRLR